jgi:hypothetical protein
MSPGSPSRRLAGLELRPKLGFSARRMKDAKRSKIALALRRALSAFPRDTEAV